jgi:hypothetical protein
MKTFPFLGWAAVLIFSGVSLAIHIVAAKESASKGDDLGQAFLIALAIGYFCVEMVAIGIIVGGAVEAWSRRSLLPLGRSLIASIGLVFALSQTVTMELGWYNARFGDAAAQRRAETDRRVDLKSEMARLTERRAQIAETASVADLEARAAKSRLSLEFKQSAGCTKVGAYTRQACSDLKDLEARLGAAQEVARIDVEMGKFRSREWDTKIVTGDANPRADILSRYWWGVPTDQLKATQVRSTEDVMALTGMAALLFFTLFSRQFMRWERAERVRTFQPFEVIDGGRTAVALTAADTVQVTPLEAIEDAAQATVPTAAPALVLVTAERPDAATADMGDKIYDLLCELRKQHVRTAKGSFLSSIDFYEAYRALSKKRGLQAMSQANVGEAMRLCGFQVVSRVTKGASRNGYADTVWADPAFIEQLVKDHGDGKGKGAALKAAA